MNRRALLSLASLGLISCFNDTPREKSLIDRTVNALRIESKDSSFQVLWQSPSDPEFLKGYHLWIAQDSSQKALITRSEVQSSDYVNIPDQLFYSGLLQLSPDSLHWRIPDSLMRTLRSRNLDSAQVLLWAEYSQSTPGARLNTPLYLSDIYPALASKSLLSPSANGAEIRFLQPEDQVSAWDQIRQGPIWGYTLSLSGPGAKSATLSADSNLEIFPDQDLPLQRFPAGLNTSSLGNAPASDTVRHWVLRQKASYAKDSSAQIKLSSLQNLNSYQIQLRSLDLKGNITSQDGSSPIETQVFRTTTQYPPYFGTKRIQLSMDNPGSGTLSWTSANAGASSPQPWVSIVGYQVKVQDLDSKDSARSFYSAQNSLPLRGIFGGHHYLFSIQAKDSSGNLSQSISLDTTLASSSSCPSGMSPILVGSSVRCMGQYEFRADTGFSTLVRAEKAAELCKSLSDDRFSVQLCTESEWNAACKNTDLAGTVDLGFSRFGDTSSYSNLLYGACNFASGKSKAARNPLCATNEGIYDLPGQLQEWTYKDSAGKINDTSFVLKGGSWNPQFSSESYAYCSSRSYGAWTRPKAYIYGRDTVVLLKNGTQTLKTSLIKSSDISRILGIKDFSSSLINFQVYDQGTLIALDTLNAIDVQNSSTFSALKNGYDYRAQDTLRAIITSQVTKTVNRVYRSQAVGFRCCASTK